MPEIVYRPTGEVSRSFLKSDKFVRGIRGPVGSGKSAACCVELFRRASQQTVNPMTKKRHSRVAIIRNTFPELRTTTVKTWLDWFPEDIFRKFNWQPPYTHMIRFADMEMECLFLALDRPDDVKKLLSLELTMAFINEAREMGKSIVDAVSMRVGRYPAMKDGGCKFSGVIMDTNSPEDDHWWAVMSGDMPPPEWLTQDEQLSLVTPEGWEFFAQPPAMLDIKEDDGSLKGYEMNPVAENVKNLDPKYYPRMLPGKSKNWINVYVLNRYGTTEEGKPVYHGFREDVHVGDVDALPGLELLCGIDFGLTPACILGQRGPGGQWRIIREIIAQDMGARRFGEHILHVVSRDYPDHHLRGWGDPAGDIRAQTDETTPFQMLSAAGLTTVFPGPTNDPAERIDTVESVLGRMVDGEPGLLVDRSCRMIVKGFISGYHYRRMQISGEGRYDEKPNKNRYSHPHDALQYLFTGAGEGRRLRGNRGDSKPKLGKADFDVFDRMRPVKRKRHNPLDRLGAR